MKNSEFIEKLINIANNYKTRYMWGTFGSVITEKLIDQKVDQYPNNYSSSRQDLLNGLADKNCWAFDCVGLIKGVVWGWSGDTDKNYGGAKYESNGVGDLNTTGMFETCSGISDNFDSIPEGAALHQPGHIGIYIGDGKVVQATLGKIGDGVIITPLSANKWTKHGKFPFISYSEESPSVLIGDVNGDGIVNDKDVVALKRYIANFKNITIIEANSDINGDGVVNDKDAVLLARKVSGIDTGNKKIEAGSIVRIRNGAYIYGTQKPAASFVYSEKWSVTKISLLNKNKVLIGYNEAGTNNINTWFYLSDLTAV